MGEPSSLIAELASRLPVTVPVPTPTSHPHLVLAADLATEEDLLHNPENLRSWLAYAQHVKERVAKTVPDASSPPSPEQRLLGAFASREAREGLQQLVMIYERALAVFPTSFKLWKTYMNLRQTYVLGELTDDARKARAAQAKRGANYKTNVREVIDGVEEAHSWTGALDAVVGYAEWRALFATGERMLAWLSHLPVPWLMHLGMVLHPNCPAPFKGAYARRTFDRALRTLPPSLHGRIWGMYLRWAELTGGETGERVWRRFLKVDSSLTERHIAFLLDSDPPRALSAAKYLLLIARQSVKNDYLPEDGKSPYQLFIDFLELVERYAGEVGMDEEETIKVQQEAKMSEEEAVVDAEKAGEGEQARNAEVGKAVGAIEPASVQGRLMRIAGPPIPNGQSQIVAPPRSLGSGKVVAASKGPARGKGGKAVPVKPTEEYDPDVDPSNPRLLDVEGIVHKNGLSVYPDQAGRLWTGLATYWIKRGEFDRASSTFEKGLASVVTVRDFTQIFDAYAEFSETMISTLMEALGDEDNLEDEEFDVEDTEQELDERMKDFEKLMDRRPFIVNEVLLRRNKDEVVEWEKRIALYSAAAQAQVESEGEGADGAGAGAGQEDGDARVIKTYLEAIDAINPRKATGPLYPIYVNFAKFYEEGGTAGQAEPNLAEARKIFEKATRVPFKDVDELAEIWCEWAEMELRNENYDEAIRLMQRATTVPKNTKVDYYNDSVSPQSRLFKSLKLWSFYSDLEESIGSVESTKAVYDKIMELKIANAQTIVNYASFLEENKYFEESFKVYERGTELFQFPIAFELWNIYLSKFVKRYGGKKLERARDLFEQSLESCPAKSCKPLFMMYAKLEEEHGLAKRAMGIYDRACGAVQEQDKFDMYTIYIAKATANFGLPATRPIYERALDDLPDRQAATMCRRFAQMERKLGEIDRARALYGHASQFCDPRVMPDFWAEWNAFEIETGSEDTFREMLRIKRSVQASYNTESSFIAAQTAAAKSSAAADGGEKPTDAASRQARDAADPMAGLEREAGEGAAAGGKMRQAGAPSFVASTLKTQNAHGIDEAEAGQGDGANPEAIEIDEDDV